MKQDNTKIKYFLYARKSSESEDRQVASIEAQISELEKIAKDEHLNVIDTLSESRSAKAPGRPIFAKMIDRIHKGEANGILCWKLNRLARNPIDGGQVSWMLQQNVVQHIQTHGKSYYPTDNVIVMAVELGMANQFVRDLSTDTKRGLKNKLEKGWLPNMAPLGYLNDKLNHTIIKDPERFSIVRKMWDLALTGSYSTYKILEIATNEWGFRTRVMKKSSDNTISQSGVHRILTNLFYAGTMVRKDGSQYQGKHEPMITLEEYDLVQKLLGKAGKPRPQKHEYAFTGAIRCGECGCLYTAEQHTKIIKTTGKLKTFIHYHCTKRKKDFKCSQRKNIPAQELELQIEKEIEKYTILPEFLAWALEGLNSSNDTEIEDRKKIYEAQHKALVQTQNELDELTKMRYRQLIDDGVFLKEKDELEGKIQRCKGQLRETESRAEEWLELTEKTFRFATYARKAFMTGGLELKKEILLSLGQTPIIKEGNLIIEPNEWLAPIKNGYPELEKEYIGLELGKTPLNRIKTEALSSIRTRWGA